MKTYPNQRIIKVQKERCDKNNLYALINLDALQYAMIDLKGEEFKLWCYLDKNQNGFQFALSPIDAVKWGIGSVSSYNRAVRALIDKGYLVKVENNHYDFYEKPQFQELIITVNKEE